MTVVAVALVTWRWYHYYIYSFGLERQSILAVLYNARPALLGLVAIWAAVNRRPGLLVVLFLISVFPDSITRRREGFHWWLAQPTLAYLIAALAFYLTESRFATLRDRLRPLAVRVATGVRNLFGDQADKHAGADRKGGSRALAALGGAAVAGFTAWIYTTRLIGRAFGGAQPFEPPRWLYVISISWAALALGYAIWPRQRLRPWLLILLLPCLLAWSYIFSREQEARQERQLREARAVVRHPGLRESVTVPLVEQRVSEAGRTSFAELDSDADGMLTRAEFGSRPQPLLFDRAGRDFDRLEPAIAAHHFRDCDYDQDGLVSETEWTCRVDRVSRTSRLMSLPLHRERSFKIIDADGDARISPDELLTAPRACRPYLDEDVESLFEQRDVDEDGRLTSREWGTPG